MTTATLKNGKPSANGSSTASNGTANGQTANGQTASNGTTANGQTASTEAQKSAQICGANLLGKIATCIEEDMAQDAKLADTIEAHGLSATGRYSNIGKDMVEYIKLRRAAGIAFKGIYPEIRSKLSERGMEKDKASKLDLSKYVKIHVLTTLVPSAMSLNKTRAEKLTRFVELNTETAAMEFRAGYKDRLAEFVKEALASKWTAKEYTDAIEKMRMDAMSRKDKRRLLQKRESDKADRLRALLVKGLQKQDAESFAEMLRENPSFVDLVLASVEIVKKTVQS
jgi:hypothetical protein